MGTKIGEHSRQQLMLLCHQRGWRRDMNIVHMGVDTSRERLHISANKLFSE